MEKEATLLSGDIKKTYVSYLIPTIVGMLTNSVYCIVDVMFVGLCIGAQGLAAFNIAMPVYTIYSSLGLMLGVGGAVTISVLIGKGKKEQVDKVFTLTVLCSALIGMGMSAYGLLFPDAFARMLGASPQLMQGVKDYLQPLHCVALIYILNCTMQVIIRADYNPKLVMVAAVCGNATNILFDWLFVSVFQWGLFGAAAATALGPCVAMSIWIFHYLLKKNTFKFTKHFWDFSLLQRIFKNGVGTFILELSLGCVVIFFNIVLLDVSGQDAVAVFAIISNIAYVGKGIFNGISQAAQPMLSVNYGARKIKRVQATLRTALVCALIFSLGCYLLILIFPQPIIGFFISSSDAGLIGHGVWAARIYFISFVFTAVNTVLMYYFQSVESIKVTTMIALMRGLIFILLGLAVFPKFLGELGVWLTITFAEVATLLITLPIKRKLDKLLASEAVE